MLFLYKSLSFTDIHSKMIQCLVNYIISNTRFSDFFKPFSYQVRCHVCNFLYLDNDWPIIKVQTFFGNFIFETILDLEET